MEEEEVITYYIGTFKYEDYDDVGAFKEGLIWVRKDGQQFHIHPDGTPAYTQRYGLVSHFKNGLAWASKMKKNPEGFQIVESFHIRPDGCRVD